MVWRHKTLHAGSYLLGLDLSPLAHPNPIQRFVLFGPVTLHTDQCDLVTDRRPS